MFTIEKNITSISTLLVISKYLIKNWIVISMIYLYELWISYRKKICIFCPALADSDKVFLCQGKSYGNTVTAHAARFHFLRQQGMQRNRRTDTAVLFWRCKSCENNSEYSDKLHTRLKIQIKIWSFSPP